jgi:multidrug efflux pump subunit AcrA (membrane-fusion protein)
MSASTLGIAISSPSTIKLARVEVPRAARKVSRRRLLLAATGLLSAAAAFYQPWKSLSAESEADISAITDGTRTVTVGRPSLTASSNVVLPATIRPWQGTELHARVNGYLTRWHVDLGTRVKAGDLLAEIETPELDQQTTEAEAMVREAEAATIQARAERTEAQAELKVAESQLVRVRAETELARSQRTRSEKLLRNRALSQEDYDTSSTQLDVRAADVTAAESAIARRRSNLETRAAIIDAREATTRSRQANVNRLKEMQVFKRIVAPFDGVITRRSAEVGMLVTAGKEALFDIEDMDRVRVQVKLPQAYSMQARVGTVATVSVPESSAQALQAKITRVADSVDSSNRTMLAEIELDNSSGRFQPGSYAQITLTTAQSESQWTIPTNTLAMRVDGPHVALVNDQHKIEIRPVILGRDLGNRVLVVNGIQGQEQLVVNPSDDLATGLTVKVGSSEKSQQELVQR